MRRAVFVLLILTLIPAHDVGANSTPAYRVIVNLKNPVTVLERGFVADVFLKKITSWTEGEIIRPADLAVDSPVRARFSEEILRRSVTGVKSFWQQRIFSGRDVPPPELNGDDEVMNFVAKSAGAIGYVSGGTVLKHVKAVGVR